MLLYKHQITLNPADPSFKSIHTNYHFMYSNFYNFRKIKHLFRWNLEKINWGFIWMLGAPFYANLHKKKTNRTKPRYKIGTKITFKNFYSASANTQYFLKTLKFSFYYHKKMIYTLLLLFYMVTGDFCPRYSRLFVHKNKVPFLLRLKINRGFRLKKREERRQRRKNRRYRCKL